MNMHVCVCARVCVCVCVRVCVCAYQKPNATKGPSLGPLPTCTSVAIVGAVQQD